MDEFYIIRKSTLTGIADSIRSKTGKDERIPTEVMKDEIQSIDEQLVALMSNTIKTMRVMVPEISKKYALYQCTSLEALDIPITTSVADNSIDGCTSLKSLNAPSLETARSYSFRSAGLTSLILPKCKELYPRSFSKCGSLSKVDLNNPNNVMSFSDNAFVECTSLTAFIVRINAVATLRSNVFQLTPIESGTGYIYVPAALVDQYKQATNWTVYAEQIRAIEDYPEITGGAA